MSVGSTDANCNEVNPTNFSHIRLGKTFLYTIWAFLAVKSEGGKKVNNQLHLNLIFFLFLLLKWERISPSYPYTNFKLKIKIAHFYSSLECPCMIKDFGGDLDDLQRRCYLFSRWPAHIQVTHLCEGLTPHFLPKHPKLREPLFFCRVQTPHLNLSLWTTHCFIQPKLWLWARLTGRD